MHRLQVKLHGEFKIGWRYQVLVDTHQRTIWFGQAA